MKLRYIITIGILLVLLVTTTCNYFYQKRNEERGVLDSKAVNYYSYIGDITFTDSSVCGLPYGNCLYGVELLDSTTYVNGDSIVVKLFLRAIHTSHIIMMKPYAISNQIIKITYVNNQLMTMYIGCPEGEDLVKLHLLLKQKIDPHYIKINGEWHSGKVYK